MPHFGHSYLRRLQLYSKFKFCNYLTPKIGLVSEKFSYSPWEALKVRRVAHFMLRFGLEIDYSFTVTETRWIFFLLPIFVYKKIKRSISKIVRVRVILLQRGNKRNVLAADSVLTISTLYWLSNNCRQKKVFIQFLLVIRIINRN